MSGAALAEENARLKALLALTQAALADPEEARHRLEAILTDLRREKSAQSPRS
jgi:transposase